MCVQNNMHGLADQSASHASDPSLCVDNTILASFCPCCCNELEISIVGLMKDVPAAFLFLSLIILAVLSPPHVLRHVIWQHQWLLPIRITFALRPPLRAPPR